ncbi:dephospho-CoA kinase [Scheffersomyces xylosifermentans]|uniref:dephospho-CoA kinase n=1 Tax=Scheffersomyces xylosifermentans TaxID=1304137 RepID=UPI00315DC901
MLIVGLTGGIGTGKSTVSKRIREKHNLAIVDADLIAKEVVYPGKRAYKKVVETFSQDVPDLINPEDQSLNRAALGRAVFGNKERLAKLNAIVHPAVKWEIGRQILKAYFTFKSVVILDVPLLFESGLHKICGVVITVSSTKELQIERLLKRNPELSRDDIEKRISSQMSNEERNHRADLVIDNTKNLFQLENNVDAAIRKIIPSVLWTVLDYFPPIGLLSAAYTYTVRSREEKAKGKLKED